MRGWLEGRRHEFPPALRWPPNWDIHAERLLPMCTDHIIVGAHVHSETAAYYGYVKDWPAGAWQELFARFGTKERVQWVLFGQSPEPCYEGANVLDVRGKTDFPELLSIIKNRCRLLIAPDSGVLAMAYYLATPFALDIVSLWSDPRRGVLGQGCASPNPLLRHVPLLGPGRDVRNLSVGAVEAVVRQSIVAAHRSRDRNR